MSPEERYEMTVRLVDMRNEGNYPKAPPWVILGPREYGFGGPRQPLFLSKPMGSEVRIHSSSLESARAFIPRGYELIDVKEAPFYSEVWQPAVVA